MVNYEIKIFLRQLPLQQLLHDVLLLPLHDEDLQAGEIHHEAVP